MNGTSSDAILLLKQRLAEQTALIEALQEKQSNWVREIDHLQTQLGKLRRINFGSRSENVSRRIAQIVRDDRNAGSALAPTVWFAYSSDRTADPSCQLQQCAADGCECRISQWPDNGSRLLGSCSPKDPRCARPHPVSPDRRSPEVDRSVVRHQGGYKGNSDRAATS